MPPQKDEKAPLWYELKKIAKRFLAFCAVCNARSSKDNYEVLFGCSRDNLVQLRFVPQLYIISKGPHGLFREALKNMAGTGIKSMNKECELILKEWMRDNTNVSCDCYCLVRAHLLTADMYTRRRLN
jgi:hypothetical protein